MEPVSSSSAALLRLESPSAPLHVGWVARLERAGAEGFDAVALRSRIAGRLIEAPRLRRVVARRLAPSGALVWREDPDFRIERHVAIWPGGAAGEEELRVAVERFIAEPMGHELPLWRVLVVPRTRAGGAVIAGKLHRALVDGDDPGLLRAVVCDPAAAAAEARAAAADALALDEFRAAGRLRALAPVPSERTRIGATLRRSAIARTEGPLVAAPSSFLDGTSGAHRTLVTARADLGRLVRIAERTGTTLHDVVLALATGVLRRLATASGVAPVDVRALVPVGVDGEELLGDAPCAVLELPVAEQRAAARLSEIHHAMEAAAGVGRAAAGNPRATPAPALIAGPPEQLASRLALAARLCNVTIPSTRAPHGALYVGGVRVRALFAASPLPEGHALSLSTIAYDRRLHLAAAADPTALAAIGRLPIMLADAVEELGVSTGVRGAAAPALPARPPRPSRPG
jgi:diacylglycerol O-acyltransferase